MDRPNSEEIWVDTAEPIFGRFVDGGLMSTLDGKTIVVADDELGFRELIGDELALAGAEPVAVESGDQVVPQFAQRRIDAVISDIRMPRIDGLVLLDLLKKENRQFPIFMMTGFSDAQIEDIYNRGADGIYTKPCDMDEVVKDLHQALLPLAERYLQPYQKSEGAGAVTLSIPTREHLRGGEINVGRGGLFVKGQGPLPRVGAEIHFAIKIEAERLEFKGIAVCRWAKSIAGIGDAFGLQIRQLEPQANRIYLELLEKMVPVASIPSGPGDAK